MSFDDIEKLLGAPLPTSARRHAAWWANDAGGSHSQSKAWLERGFKTEQVDVEAGRVVFARDGAPPEVTPHPNWDPSWPKLKPGDHHPAYGAMKGMLTILPGVDLTEPADPEWVERINDPNATANDLVGGFDDE